MINLKFVCSQKLSRKRENDLEQWQFIKSVRERTNLKPVNNSDEFLIMASLINSTKFRKRIGRRINVSAEENVNRCRIGAARNIFAVTKGKEWRGGGSGCALLSAGRDKETDFKGFFADGRVNVHPLSVWPTDSPPSLSVSLFHALLSSQSRIHWWNFPFPFAIPDLLYDIGARPNEHLSQIIGVVSDLAEPLSRIIEGPGNNRGYCGRRLLDEVFPTDSTNIPSPRKF